MGGHRGGARRHKPLSYANVTATLALVFALGAGTALAAHHYLLSSSKQISPKLLKELKKPGLQGRTGATGAQGNPGQTGSTGPPGPGGQSATDTTVVGTNTWTALGTSPPYTFYGLCLKSGGLVDAELAYSNTGPAANYEGISDSSEVASSSTVSGVVQADSSPQELVALESAGANSEIAYAQLDVFGSSGNAQVTYAASDDYNNGTGTTCSVTATTIPLG
jgi:hypothetical protein